MYARLSNVESGRSNNLNLIRLVLASSVIFSHGYPILGRFQSEPVVHYLHFGGDIGDLAVFSFFFISGYLIVRSAVYSSDPARFIMARVLRIFPGLAIATLFCIFVVGPLSTKLPLSDYFRSSAIYRYLGTIVLHHNSGLNLPGVFQDHFITEINLPLWTLSSEWSMYMLSLLGCMAFKWRQSTRFASRFSWTILGVALLSTLQMMPLLYKYTYKWAAFFVMGALCYFIRHRIRLYPWTSIMLLVTALVLVRFAPHVGKTMLPFSLCYFLLAIGFHPAWHAAWFTRFGDFSYGLYIYGWPIQQMLSTYFTSPVPLFFAAYLVALTLAAASWYLVESPCLSLKPGRGVSRGDSGRLPRW